jgi:imidazolonepropionase
VSGRLVVLRSAKQLLTMYGTNGLRRGSALRELGLIQDGALLMRDGIIVDAGPTRRIENLGIARDAEVIDATGRIVMPVFCDSGVQLLTQAVREEQDTLLSGEEVELERAGRWERYISTTSPRRLEFRAHQLLERMARHGTGAVEVVAESALSAASTLKALRVHAALNQESVSVVSTLLVSDLHSSGAESEAALPVLLNDTLPTVARRRLASNLALNVGGAEHNPLQSWRAAQVARSIGMGIEVIAAPGNTGAVQFTADIGARSFAGFSGLNEYEIRTLAGSPVVATIRQNCPVSRALPRKLIDNGVALALGSGFAATHAGTYSMQETIFEASTTGGFSLGEALTASTINAAHGIGLGSTCGSLEPGKQANFLILNAPDYRELAMRRGINFVHAMVQRGRVVYREGEIRK